MPTFTAWQKPVLRGRATISKSGSEERSSLLPSVEPLSTTMSLKSLKVCRSRDAMHRRKSSLPL